MADLKETAKQLTDLADEYEQAAVQLRQAAKLVSGLPSLTADTNGAAARPAGRSTITEADYLAVFQKAPNRKRNATGVFDELEAVGKTPVSIDAVRTAIYRLESAGKLERVGHGLFRLAR